MGWACLIGAVGGLVFFGPMAAVIWIKNRFPEWFTRNYYRLHWHTSIAGGAASGFWIACTVYHTFGRLLLACLGVLMLAASIKIGLSDRVGSTQPTNSAQESGNP
jgi:hypothetical protein